MKRERKMSNAKDVYFQMVKMSSLQQTQHEVLLNITMINDGSLSLMPDTRQCGLKK